MVVMVRSRWGVLVAGVVAGVVLSGAFVAVAAIPNSTTDVITGCYAKSDGSLRVIDAQKGAKCASGELKVSWNQKGQRGQRGQRGRVGRSGARGPAGPANRISDRQIALLRWDRDPGSAAIYPTGDLPYGVAFDGTNIWVTNSGSGTVSKMNRATGTKVDYTTGGGPQAAAFDGTNIWVANFTSDSVSKMDPATGTKVDFPVGDGPFGVAFDGTNI
jgi:YVTN family beta-propeller protein